MTKLTDEEIEINNLKDEIHQNAVKHGWYEQKVTEKHCLCLIISEFMEAIEADRKDKRADLAQYEQSIVKGILNQSDAFEKYIKNTIEDELADVIIRTLDLAGWKNVTIRDYKHPIMYIHHEGYLLTEKVFDLVTMVTNWRGSFCTENPSQSAVYNFILWGVEDIYYNIADRKDIWDYVKIKMQYNKLRPYKHGKKY